MQMDVECVRCINWSVDNLNWIVNFAGGIEWSIIMNDEYSDNDGELSTLMEHGEFWKCVPHVSISEH